MRYSLITTLLALLPAVSFGDAAGPRQLYVNKCARCHKLYEPAQYRPADWNAWVEKMRRKARLTDEQVAALSTLATNKPPAK